MGVDILNQEEDFRWFQEMYKSRELVAGRLKSYPEPLDQPRKRRRHTSRKQKIAAQNDAFQTHAKGRGGLGSQLLHEGLELEPAGQGNTGLRCGRSPTRLVDAITPIEGEDFIDPHSFPRANT